MREYIFSHLYDYAGELFSFLPEPVNMNDLFIGKMVVASIPRRFVKTMNLIINFKENEKNLIIPSEKFRLNECLSVDGCGNTLARMINLENNWQRWRFSRAVFSLCAGWVFLMSVRAVFGTPDCVGAVRADVGRCFAYAPFMLRLSCETPQSVIYYTFNGSLPSPGNGNLYTGVLTIEGTSVLRARAFRDGYVSSPVSTHTYIFPDDVIRQSPGGAPPSAEWPVGNVNGQKIDYGMDPDIVNSPKYAPLMTEALTSIPAISLVTDLGNLFDASTGIFVNADCEGIEWERPVSMELIYPDGRVGFQIDSGLRIRGGYSRVGENPKHAFRVLFRKRYGCGHLNYPLFGGDGTDSYDNIDLRTAQNYSWSFGNDCRNTMVREVWNRDLQFAMGCPSTRSRYYHLYINGEYWGVFMTQERAEASYAESYFGGDKLDYDVVKVARRPNPEISATDGSLDAWRSLWTMAKAGFEDNRDYYRACGLNPDGTPNPALPELLDPGNLIDYMLCTYYAGDLDGPVSGSSPNNFYMIYNRVNPDGFKCFRHDAEHTLLSNNRDRTGPYSVGDQFSASNPQWLHQQLIANSEYRILFADHAQRHFFNNGTLTPESCRMRFRERMNEVSTAIIAESARWGDSSHRIPFTLADWSNACEWVLNEHMAVRTDIVLNQLKKKGWFPSVDAPVFNRMGGVVERGFPFSQTADKGSIYFTLNGDDPRLPGGAVNPNADIASGVVELRRSCRIKSRARSGGEWSALTEAFFSVGSAEDQLRVSELMFNPAPPPDSSPYNARDFEFIELENTGDVPLGLACVKFTDDVEVTLSDVVLERGELAVVVANRDAFASRYDTNGLVIAGVYSGHLKNGGKRLALTDPFGSVIQEFYYSDDWFPSTDGGGHSLVISESSAPLYYWSQPFAWRASILKNGTPGRAESLFHENAVVINELLPHSNTGSGWIELHNTTEDDIDIGGWLLSDDPTCLAKFEIAGGVILPAHGYLTFTEGEHFARPDNPGAHEVFVFTELGGHAVLASAEGGVPTGYRALQAFGATGHEVTVGRYERTDGVVDFTALDFATPGMPNAPPRVGPVVMSEIMYHPVIGGYEFVELYNLSATDISLCDPDHPSNTWRFTGAINFSLPEDAVIPAGGYALVTSAEPSVFRHIYGVPAQVSIYGPYTMALNNDGESVKLRKPGDPSTNGTIPYILVDRVKYDDDYPWPSAANGLGPSLVKIDLAAYGNDPSSWTVSTCADGSPGEADAFVPRRWLIAWGWTNDFRAVELSDSDHDHMSVWEEYMADTVPTNALSNLSLWLESGCTCGELRLCWSSSTNRVYTIESASALNTPTAPVLIMNRRRGTGGTMSYSVPLTNAAGFYRVCVTLPAVP